MKKEKSSFGSGDINLAAALLTMGIPTDPSNPIELIARDNGKDYVRFHFLQSSACGKYDVWALNEAWSDYQAFAAANPTHPFTLLMQFISARPRGCNAQGDWLAHAAQFLEVPYSVIRQTFEEIRKACTANPESPLCYVCAYVHNRMALIDATKRREAAGQFQNMMSKGKSVALIPAKASPRIRDYLLSKIR